MAYYVIEMPHEPEEHGRAVAEALRTAPDAQLSFLWGCRVGAHSAWAVIEADGRGEALDIVPGFLRARARVHRVDRYTVADVPSFWEEAA